MRNILLVIFLCTFGAVARAQNVIIVYGNDAAPGEVHAANELAADFEKVYSFKPVVLQEDQVVDTKTPSLSAMIYVGAADTNAVIGEMAAQGLLNVSATDPGPEAFVIKTISPAGLPTLVIAGSDERGTLYGVYYFSEKYLGIDPYEYWTDRFPEKRDAFELPDVDFREKPPVFPLRGYFDNDNDMIANWKGRKLIIEFDTWKEIIDSLARLRYNYIDLHDTLGRAEFWTWSYYTTKFPGYHTDLELVDRIIDYAHSKGLMVQIPMYLGWEFHHLPYEKICLSKYHDDWMEVYRYYLEESPLGKADLFLQRPRDPWKDIGYKCAEETDAGIEPGPLMTDMFNGLLELVEKHRPGGRVICDLWAEGRAMWRANNFDPEQPVMMLWADGGYANYSEWPEDFKGHEFGVYIHAGYYLNHVMQDPYPGRIKEATLEAVRRGMTANYFVNGQDFKHFILNLEACARAAWDPGGFDPDAFYLEWTARYFGAEAAPVVVQSLKALHEASAAAGGFTKVMDKTDDILSMLRFMTPQKVDDSYLDGAIEDAKRSLELAEQAVLIIPVDAMPVFEDQIMFPAIIYLENLKLFKTVVETMNAFQRAHDDALSADERSAARADLDTWKKRMPPQLAKLRDLLSEGSKWEKWAGWTHPDNFRKITPPPDPGDVKRIVRSLN